MLVVHNAPLEVLDDPRFEFIREFFSRLKKIYNQAEISTIFSSIKNLESSQFPKTVNSQYKQYSQYII